MYGKDVYIVISFMIKEGRERGREGESEGKREGRREGWKEGGRIEGSGKRENQMNGVIDVTLKL